MGICCQSGRARAVKSAITQWREKAAAEGAEAAIIVPAQLTLQAERDCLEALNIEGSFNIQVYSPQRLFKRIFAFAGEPSKSRVDEQGRVMLMHLASIKCRDRLKWYSKAVDKPSFAGKLVEQIAAFKQASLKPCDIKRMAVEPDGTPSRKLEDLAEIFAAYEELLKDRFMDGEDELNEAAKRVTEAGFLTGARVCVYGFDMLTPTLSSLILGLNSCAESVDVIMVGEDDPDARDYQIFEPVNRSINMFLRLAAQNGVRCASKRLSEPARKKSGGLGFLEKELYCVPNEKYGTSVSDVQMAALPNPEAEAEFVMSLIRRMCRLRGWRYRDFAIALMNGDELSRDALDRAFTRAKTPLFLSSGRPADRHCLSQALLSAMRAASGGYRLDDMICFLRSGFSSLNDDECDALVNFAAATNMRGKRWLKPVDDVTEPLRQRAVEPVAKLGAEAGKAIDTKGKLAAIYGFLENIDACKKLESTRASLEGMSMPVWAMEGAQVYNRIIAALDQMYELMKDEDIDLKLIYDCLSRALGQTNVKALPQSADAVEAGALEHLRGKPLRALIITGAVETGNSLSGGLLDERETALLASGAASFMALSQRDITRMQKLNMLSLMALTDDYLLITRPMSDTSGRAIQPGGLMRAVSQVLPNAPLRGVSDADALMSLCFEQPDTALSRLPTALNARVGAAKSYYEALKSIDRYSQRLDKVMSARNFKVYSEKLPGDLTRRAYGPLDRVSVSRLERFALCPFRHFASYALRPVEFRTAEISPRDAGVFYHAALEAFMKKYSSELGDMSVEQSRKRMDEITDKLINATMNAAYEPGEIEKAEAGRMRTVARRAADIITRQFDGSRFIPVDIEADVASGTARVALDDAELTGRIDRVDVFDTGTERYVRVIDYKKGVRRVSLPEIYAGLQLQLVMYLASAVSRFDAKPAGMFYFSVSDPLIDTRERDADVIEEARTRLLRLDGLAINDSDIIRAMADDPEAAVSVTINKDGTLKKSQKLLDDGGFEYLMKRGMDAAKDMLRDIKRGGTDISPAVTSQLNACDYCEFKTLCQFDKRLDGAEERNIELMKSSEVISAMQGGE